MTKKLRFPRRFSAKVLRHTESIMDNDDKEEKKAQCASRKQRCLGACNCSPPKLDRSVHSRGSHFTGQRRREGTRVPYQRKISSIAHTGIIIISDRLN